MRWTPRDLEVRKAGLGLGGARRMAVKGRGVLDLAGEGGNRLGAGLGAGLRGRGWARGRPGRGGAGAGPRPGEPTRPRAARTARVKAGSQAGGEGAHADWRKVRARGGVRGGEMGGTRGRDTAASACRLAGSCVGAGRAAGSALAPGELTKPRREGRLAARRPGPLAPPPRDPGPGPRTDPDARPAPRPQPPAPAPAPTRAARAQVAPPRPEAGPGGAGRRGAAPGAAMTAQRAPRARP